MKVLFLFAVSLVFSDFIQAADIEVGKVEWGRDLERAYADSEKSGKPVLVLFQEVPGCSGCKKFGKEVLSHPQIVEAIESEFEPVLVYNNRPGADAEILKSFGEPSWNYQVIRFLNPQGKDVIPRKDKVWTTEALVTRMVDALAAVDREVPGYLEALAGKAASTHAEDVAFAMFCFWTGERKLEAIEGVLMTDASDQKNQLSGTSLEKLNLSEVQATKINAFARTDPAMALLWLSPRQRAIFTKS
ncbi:MAG: thioredoxin family protein [Verrucomicrobiales bacterium]|nr:thioredoxin family protein [Verrucomicrobiales bacterium]